MNLSMLMLSFGLMTPAQTREPTPLLGAPPTDLAVAAADRPEMYRHIEVMRQLLRRKLGMAGVYHAGQIPQSTSSAGNAYAAWSDSVSASSPAVQGYFPDSAAGTAGAIDGVYLPGYGVVFTVSLSAHGRTLRSATTKPVAKALSEWERAEREVKGEKPAPTAAADPTPSVTDIIVDLLAMNGQRFTKLRDDERITVVVTLHDRHTTAANQSPFTAYPTMGQAPMTPYRGAVTTTDLVVPTPGSGTSPAKDYELLADMHLKQKQYDAALTAYSKAIAKAEDEVAKSSRPDEAQHYLASLLMRQAQAQVATGQTEPALALLARIAKLQASDGPTKMTTPAIPAPKQRVPSKLIITAPKRLLDEVQKISLADFRKGLQIEDLTLDGK